MDQVLPLLTAFGLGSVVSALVQAWLAQRNRASGRSFDERKAAYIGLLEAYQSAVEGKDAMGIQFGYWQTRCDLVAPKAVRDAASKVSAIHNDKSARNRAMRELIDVMRSDLGVIKDK